MDTITVWIPCREYGMCTAYCACHTFYLNIPSRRAWRVYACNGVDGSRQVGTPPRALSTK